MDLRGGWHEQTAHGSNRLGSTEYRFSAEVLSENTADHLREYVTPVKGAENGRLNGWAPREFTGVLSIRTIRPCSIARTRIALQ